MAAYKPCCDIRSMPAAKRRFAAVAVATVMLASLRRFSKRNVVLGDEVHEFRRWIVFADAMRSPRTVALNDAHEQVPPAEAFKSAAFPGHLNASLAIHPPHITSTKTFPLRSLVSDATRCSMVCVRMLPRWT